MKTSEKLKVLLEKEFKKKVVKIERCYPTDMQRVNGAWIWWAVFEDKTDTGSFSTMTDCVKSGIVIGCHSWGTEVYTYPQYPSNEQLRASGFAI